MNKLILTAFAVIVCSVFSQKAVAQDAVPNGHVSPYLLAASNNTQIISRSIFLNRDESICFVDAELLHYSLEAIVISDRCGNEIKRMDIEHKQVNAIHELPFESLEKGDYRITLVSPTSSESFPFSW